MPGPDSSADDPLRWLDEGFLAALGSALEGADLEDPGLRGTVAVVVPATAGRPRRSRSSTPPADGAPASVQGSFDIEAGRVVAWHAGEVPSQPGAVLTLPAADARSIVEGEEQPSVLFMQGRLKADGDMRIILAVLRATASTNYAPGRATLAESITH